MLVSQPFACGGQLARSLLSPWSVLLWIPKAECDRFGMWSVSCLCSNGEEHKEDGWRTRENIDYQANYERGALSYGRIVSTRKKLLAFLAGYLFFCCFFVMLRGPNDTSSEQFYRLCRYGRRHLLEKTPNVFVQGDAQTGTEAKKKRNWQERFQKTKILINYSFPNYKSWKFMEIARQIEFCKWT